MTTSGSCPPLRRLLLFSSSSCHDKGSPQSPATCYPKLVHINSRSRRPLLIDARVRSLRGRGESESNEPMGQTEKRSRDVDMTCWPVAPSTCRFASNDSTSASRIFSSPLASGCCTHETKFMLYYITLQPARGCWSIYFMAPQGMRCRGKLPDPVATARVA